MMGNMGFAMMPGMWIGTILILTILVLGVLALLKYLRWVGEQ